MWLKNPSTAWEKLAKIGSSAVSKSPKAALSTIPDVKDFYHTDERFHLGKFA